MISLDSELPIYTLHFSRELLSETLIYHGKEYKASLIGKRDSNSQKVILDGFGVVDIRNCVVPFNLNKNA